ncbi:uncharacterized protein LOC110919436 [Helianthus annuus]|uniref:uncharacterized protein LOC110919436 n=1 Tax=Helianthus annuus TaxID=4232 RepID=UPI000B8FFFD3|nr:uncharacterized protein LOC110919436 [Helianthus annuus]
MLEVIASHDLWIWHAYFGVVGSNNDINVINQSPLFNEFLEGNALPCNFTLIRTQYPQGYYLTDGIYPEWSTLVKTFLYSHTDKLKFFAKCQESSRKDVERAFGVLQARWAIIRGPSRSWSLDNISDIMCACIILHNMIVEDEGHAISNWAHDDHEDDPPSYNQGAVLAFQARLERFKNLRSEEAHPAIRGDLVEHLWANRATRE